MHRIKTLVCTNSTGPLRDVSPVIHMMNTMNSGAQDSLGLAELREKFRAAQVRAVLIASLCLLLAIAMPHIGFARSYPALSEFFFWRQDVLLAFLFILVAALPLWNRQQHSSTRVLDFLATPRGLFIVAACLIGLCWLGRHFIYLDYNLSRDEQMADFDAYIFTHGKLFWPLPKFWQVHALALNQIFMLAIGDHEAWVSAYLPVNAALRAAIGFLIPTSFTSPILVAIGAVSLWRIATRLWPTSPSTRSVALILYAGSSQVIANGMTAYAMSGHLALNLVWLDLFLLNRRWAHLGALAVGFLATGLHQPLFHPLFVFSFLDLLRLQRRWRTLAFYVAGYALIGAFWLFWPHWISSHGVGQIASLELGTPDYFRRFAMAVHPLNFEAVWLTVLNLLRFISWQHLLLLPLLAVGIRTAWNHDPLMQATAKSLLLPIAVMLIVLPYQGHGWGYRYLHGVIGNSCLLACYGWAALESQGLSFRRALAWATAATFLIVMPVHLMSVHQMVSAFAVVSRTIAGSRADFVVVDNRAVPFGDDVVLNQPDLSNHPIELVASGLRTSDMPNICARGSVSFFDGSALKPIAFFFGMQPQQVSGHISDLKQTARRHSCDIVPPA